MVAPLVEFRSVVKRFGDFVAVEDVNFTIDAGEFVAIMGPSGCGKTTTLRMLAGLEAPSQGNILMDGRVMNDVPAHERDTPLVWQSLALFPFLTARENVEFGLQMRGVGAVECQRLPHQRRVTLMGRDIIHHPAIHQNLALRRRFKPGQHPQRRRLSASGRPHNGNKLASIDGEIHIFYGHEIVKAFDHRPEFNKGSDHNINFPSCGVSSTPPGR